MQLGEERLCFDRPIDKVGRSDRVGAHGLQARGPLGDENELGVLGLMSQPKLEIADSVEVAEVDADDRVLARRLRLRDPVGRNRSDLEDAFKLPAQARGVCRRVTDYGKLVHCRSTRIRAVVRSALSAWPEIARRGRVAWPCRPAAAPPAGRALQSSILDYA